MKQFISPLLLLALATSSNLLFAQNERAVLDKIYAGIAAAKIVEYDMSSSERFDSKTVDKKMFFRIQQNPRKVYMKDHNTGVELLYVSGWNNNKAYINPNGFPWVNVSLDIYGNQVRKDGHHTVLHAGFGYVTTLLKYVEDEINKRGLKLSDRITLKGELDWDGRKCLRLILEDPEYTYIKHTCTKDELLHDFADRMNVSEYMIMEKNNLGYGAKLKQGQVITIPSSFAAKVVLYVDKETYLPIVQMVYDEKGLFEKYEFRNVKVNPKTSSDEWTTQCASYGF